MIPNLLKKIAAIGFFSAFLVSCAGSFAYNRLDWLIPWWVDGYVDLSHEQRQSLREQLQPLLQQHRQEELLRYVALLNEIESDLQSPVSSAQVENWIEKMSQAATRIEQSMLQVAIDFGAGISDRQVQEFLENLYEQQEELEEELLARSEKEYAKEHTKHLTDLMERIIGRLDTRQERRLELAAQAMQRYDGVWLQDRRIWLEQLELLLQREDGWQDRLFTAYQARESGRSEEYSNIVRHNKWIVAAAIADVLNNRSDKQKERTGREFADMREMLQKLIDKPGPTF